MRSFLLALATAIVAIIAIKWVVSAPGSYSEAFSEPFNRLLGTGQQINARLLEVSESPDSIRAASQRLLQPFGVVRITRIYDTPENDPTKKEDAAPVVSDSTR